MPNTTAPATYPTKKFNKAKKHKEKPTYAVMIAAAIKSLNDRSGSSRQAILKHILANNKIESAKPAVYMCLALNKGVADGNLKMVKATGKGAECFKIGDKAKEIKEPKKPKTKTLTLRHAVKEAEVNKLATKKPTDKKSAAKKSAAKKPPAKKPDNKKPAIKKYVVKKTADKKPALKTMADKKTTDKKISDRKPANKRQADKKLVGKDPIVKRPPLSLYARAAYESAVKKLSTKKPTVKESSAKVIYMRRLFLPGRSNSTAEIWVPC